jgi:tetratricopeptide (TPR) repeat protein
MTEDEQAAFAEAVKKHQAGELDAAEAGYRQIIASNPRHADALHFLGVASLQKEHHDAAATLIRQAISINPDVPEYHMHLGLSLHGSDNIAECEQSLRRAVELADGHPDARFNLGQFLMMVERLTEAEVHLRKACEIAPGDPRYHNSLGTLMIAQSQYDEAQACFAKAAEIAPTFLLARLNLANCLIEVGDVNGAEQEARYCIENFPEDPEAQEIMARVARAKSDTGDAIGIYQKMLADDGENAEANLGLGAALLSANRIDEAVAHYQKLLEARPDDAEYYFNLGLALRAQGSDAPAIDCFNNALGLSPEYISALYARGLTELACGEFDEGLAAHEVRWADATFPDEWIDFPQEPWEGEDLNGKRLLIWSEGGIGEHLLYAGLLPVILAKGANCVWECDARLASTMLRSFPGIEVVARQRPADPRLDRDDIDCQVAMASVMYHLAPWPEGFQTTTSYLTADAERRQAYQSYLAALSDRPKIGLAWGSTDQRTADGKSLALSAWAPVLTNRAADFVTLQFGDVDAEIDQAASELGAAIHTLPDLDRFNDLDGMMALIDALDMVITTSNVTAHLAGALGKPTLLLVPYRSHWYWGIAGEQNLFYPSLIVCRQSAPGDWASSLDNAAKYLTQALETGKLGG